MAVTYQTSWDSIPGLFDPQSEVTDALFGFISDPFGSNSGFDINSLFNPEPKSQFYSEPKSQFYSEPNSQLFNPEPKSQFYSEPDPEPETALPTDSYLSFSSTPSLYQYQYFTDDDFTPNPSKRYKVHNDLFDTNNFFANPSPSLSPSLSPVGFCTNFGNNQNPNSFGIGTEGQNWCRPAPVPVSATSMAARERRKRISDKTLELGKLVPSGSRMNTAEMFQAAFDYVKFLQAQIGILTLINKNEGGEVSLVEAERMELLLGSTNLHEKFSAEGKCLVPKRVVKNLFKDKAIRSSVFVARDLDRFVESI
ncbi:hypothetical protein LUZ60_014554 [Juncus effusus]|nr:hypothetical protein LUZ60_014554 [Juncus effusus]